MGMVFEFFSSEGVVCLSLLRLFLGYLVLIYLLFNFNFNLILILSCFYLILSSYGGC
jgi:hypothetical protein